MKTNISKFKNNWLSFSFWGQTQREGNYPAIKHKLLQPSGIIRLTRWRLSRSEWYSVGVEEANNPLNWLSKCNSFGLSHPPQNQFSILGFSFRLHRLQNCRWGYNYLLISLVLFFDLGFCWLLVKWITLEQWGSFFFLFPSISCFWSVLPFGVILLLAKSFQILCKLASYFDQLCGKMCNLFFFFLCFIIIHQLPLIRMQLLLCFFI